MKLDTEQDRQVLLSLIQSATIQGGSVMVIADLVQRISGAELEPAQDEDAVSTMPVAQQGKVTTVLL